MKKSLTLRTGLLSLVLVGVFSLASCGGHEHTFGDEWKHDEEFHWHECDCGELEGKASHTFDSGVIVTAPSNNTPGSKKFTCTICAYEKTSSYIEAPDKPLNLEGVAGDTEVSLTWDAPSYNGGSAVTGYEVYDGDEWLLTSERSMTLEGLPNNVEINIKVRAINSAGAGAESDPLALTPLPPASSPSKVVDLEAAEGDQQVILTWKAPLLDGHRPITKYEVKVGDGEWVEASSETGHTITSLTNGTEYTFYVRANNQAFNGEEESIKATPAAVPSAPILNEDALYRGPGELSWGWTAPLSNGGSPIIRYETKFNDEDWVDVNMETQVTYNNIANGVEHVLKVRAVNRMGSGVALEYAQTVYEAPSAPRDVRIVERDGGLTTYWKRSANHVESGAQYQVSTKGGAGQTWLAIPESWYNEETGEYYYNLSSATNGSLVTMAVRAVCTAYTTMLTSDMVLIDGTPGAAPEKILFSGITIDTTTNPTVASVTWIAPKDKGRPITDYEVAVDGDFENVISSNGATNCLIDNLTVGEHFLQIRALNSLGYGEWSYPRGFTMAGS